MLALVAIQYRAAIRNLEGQKKVQLSIDYEGREQAFLRSVVTMTPVYAANTMAENSANNATRPRAVRRFNHMYTAAMAWSNMSAARSAATHSAIENALGVATAYNGNTADASAAQTVDEIIGEVDANGAYSSGLRAGYSPSAADTARTSYTGYPLQLTERPGANIAALNASWAPIISSDLTYNATTNIGDDRDFLDTVPYPDIHFGYGTPGLPFLARHNWWQLYLHSQIKDVANTGLGQTSYSGNEYILSLYEVPAQLAISSSAFSNIGQINNTAWGANISVAGNVYAKDANVQAGANLTGLSTTRGETMNGGLVGGYDATYTQDSRNMYESTTNVGQFFPISQASDFARSIFIPINTGTEFFDRYARANPAKTTNRSSQESWAEYTRGCHQAAMQLDVTATVASDALALDASSTITDQTPTQVTLTYKTDGGLNQTIFIFDTVSGSLPSGSQSGVWPFYTKFQGAQPVLVVDVAQLVNYLINDATVNTSRFDINHSIVVNADYTISGIENPQDPTFAGTHLAVEMAGAENLTAFNTKGFSFITNYTLNLLDDLNIYGRDLVLDSPPYPALSMFAPAIRYGATSGSRQVDLRGSVGSLKENDSTTRADLLDLKAVDAGSDPALSAQISATLLPITAITDLPPINVMNWLVVLRKK
ncbi:hypothetical protein [Rubritalea sp.]|uniref:hypothetical protein n=1 Tax=Rubritalea sp. TaxID=2109375 RepID=UPI003F4AD1D5